MFLVTIQLKQEYKLKIATPNRQTSKQPPPVSKTTPFTPHTTKLSQHIRND